MMEAQTAQALLQDQVEDLADILSLDDLRLGEDVTLFEDEEGVLYVVAADQFSFSGFAENAMVARIEAGAKLSVQQVDPQEIDRQKLTRLQGQGFVE